MFNASSHKIHVDLSDMVGLRDASADYQEHGRALQSHDVEYTMFILRACLRMSQ